MRIDASGNVGIGTTSPANKLVVKDSISTNIVGAYFDFDSVSTEGNGVLIDGGGSASGRYILRLRDAAENTRVTFLANGNVGIGRSAPDAKLDVETVGASVSESGLLLRNPSTSAYSTISHDNYTAGAWRSSLWTMANNTGSGAIFGITSADATGAAQERLRIIDNGNVGIGNASPSYTLHVSGQVAGNAAYVNTSDKRFKKNVLPLSYDEVSALDKIMRLDGVYFDWRNEEFPDMHFQEGRDLGVIAQNVEEVFPEAVKRDKEGYLSVAYAKLVAPLIEAVKELFNEDIKQNREIASLKEKNEELEKENKQIKGFLCKKYPEADFCP